MSLNWIQQKNPIYTMNLHYKLPLVNTLISLQRKYNKNYCFPSQETLLGLLEEYYGIIRCLRTLNYWLRDLEDAKLIQRVRRYVRSDHVAARSISTLYFVTVKGVKKLRKAGYPVWDRLVKVYKNSYRLAQKARRQEEAKKNERITVEEMRQIWAQKKSKIGT